MTDLAFTKQQLSLFPPQSHSQHVWPLQNPCVGLNQGSFAVHSNYANREIRCNSVLMAVCSVMSLMWIRLRLHASFLIKHPQDTHPLLSAAHCLLTAVCLQVWPTSRGRAAGQTSSDAAQTRYCPLTSDVCWLFKGLVHLQNEHFLIIYSRFVIQDLFISSFRIKLKGQFTEKCK